MYYIVYLSSATELMGEGELEEILEVSRRNNTERNITGLLVYMDGSIIQLLEGEKEVVLATYRKIISDPRHTGVIKLKEGELESRNFPEWSMGYKSVSASEAKKLEGYESLQDTELHQSFQDNSKHPAILVIKSFIKNNRS